MPKANAGLEGPLLPPELPWVLLVVPLPAAYLLGHDLLYKSFPLLLQTLLKMYLPFLAFGWSFQLVYSYLVPRPLARLRHPLARASLHVAVMTGVVLVVASALFPLFRVVAGHAMRWSHFLIVSGIFSVACVLPALALQRLRLRARSAEHRALVERKAALQAQLSALQARTDPHFLFNSLNTVASLIPENPELAERTLEPLADLFRYALESGHVRTVTLQRELAMVHRAELVRADAIRALRLETGGHEISLSDGQTARVSRRALSAIKSALGLG
jgi:two-component system sensor histidine kinase AlgZ